jgi:hypothetical protein
MLKRLAITVAAFGLVMFQADAQTHKAQHRQNSQQPSTPVAAPLQQKSNSTALQGKPEEHVKADVWIIQTPPKDRYDKAAFWTTVALAVIGFFGIVIAIWTVRTIKHQVDTFVSKERARITVDIEPIKQSGGVRTGTPYPNSDMPPPSGEIWYADLLIANSGETNAFIGQSLCKACIKATGWEPGREFITSQIGLPKVLHPHKDAFRYSARIETGHVLRLELDKEMAQAITNGSMGIYVIGQIEFGDVFDNRWTVKFCRKWGAWWFGGAWQGVNIWYDYPDDILPEDSLVNGEFRIKRPSWLQRLRNRMRGKNPDFPEVEVVGKQQTAQQQSTNPN